MPAMDKDRGNVPLAMPRGPAPQAALRCGETRSGARLHRVTSGRAADGDKASGWVARGDAGMPIPQQQSHQLVLVGPGMLLHQQANTINGDSHGCYVGLIRRGAPGRTC